MRVYYSFCVGHHRKKDWKGLFGIAIDPEGTDAKYMEEELVIIVQKHLIPFHGSVSDDSMNKRANPPNWGG